MMLTNNPLIRERHIPSIFLFANALATYSYANKRKVGCIIAQQDVLFTGYNGTPSGWNNQCEDENNKSMHDVIIHAERNALDKMSRLGVSPVGADVFCTCAPCTTCALSLIGVQVSSVFFVNAYKNDEGLERLRKAGINVIQLPSSILYPEIHSLIEDVKQYMLVMQQQETTL